MLPLQFCIIGKLGLVYLINKKTGRKDVNKRTIRPFVNRISITAESRQLSKDERRSYERNSQYK